MTALWILLGLIAVLFAIGLALLNYTCGRRPQPDFSDPSSLENSSWAPHAANITAACQWLEAQPVQPLQVVSYDNKLLFARFVPCENAKATILLFHGYHSHYAVDFSASMRYYHECGYNLLLVDQRAHGRSQGRFLTFGVRERYDVLSWVTYLSLMLGHEHPMFLCGLSMGASTVCMAADLDFPGNVRGIIADCGFTSPADILGYLIRLKYRLPPKPVIAFLNIFTRLFAGFGLRQWSTTEALARTTLPVILFHGLDDDFVPCWMSRKSYEACAGEKQLLEFPGADHGVSYLVDTPRYQQALARFLEQNLTD